MKTFLILIVLGLCLVGCGGPGANNAPEVNAPLAGNPNDATTTGSTTTGSSTTTATTGMGASGTGVTGGVAPMASGGAGGMTPMSGTESVGGGGDGVGQAAKQMAKDKAANGSSSLDHGDKDDSGQ